MKLVFITDAWQPLTGGGQKLYWEVLTRLVKKGWEIIVVTRALKHSGVVRAGLNVVRLGPAVSFFNPVGRLLFIFQAWLYCLKFNPDVFIATTWLPAFSLQLLKFFKKVPVVLLAIGFGSRHRWLENLITKKFKYDLVITDDWTFKEGKFIPNGVNLPRVQPVKKNQNFSFLFVGRHEPRKGGSVLVKAYSQVKKQYPKTRLLMFGPGYKLISQSALEQQFFQAHCLVIPALREGHPLVLFEAWAHRLPVIATDVGSVSQFVTEQNGYLVEPGNVSALAQAMIAAVRNQNLAKRGETGFNLVKNYTWDKTAEKYNRALSNLTSSVN